jgi:2,5-diamino-6-(ribosylamino)-4(3H)-pyrimidinone 5'-phosphate reductase
MTLDGKIATRNHDSKISSERDLSSLHSLRSEVDAIMIGANTALIDDPLLTNRSGSEKEPFRIIVDSQARIPLSSKCLNNAKSDTNHTIVACTKKADEAKLKAIESKGARVLRVDSSEKVDLKELLCQLRKLGIETLLLEGGGELNWSMFACGLVDEVRVTISPKVIGGREATSIVAGDGVATIKESFKLRLLKVDRIKETDEVVLGYEVLQEKGAKNEL